MEIGKSNLSKIRVKSLLYIVYIIIALFYRQD